MTPPGTTTGDAGDLFAYTILIEHCATSTAPAFNVDFRSTNTVMLRTPGGVPAATTSGVAAVITSGNGAADRQLIVSAPIILPGETLTVTYSSLMDQTVVPGTVLLSHTLGYTSDSPSTASYTTAISDVSLTCANPTLTFSYVSSSLAETALNKFVNTNADLQPGETALFRAVIRWHEGTVPQNAILKLSAGTSFPFRVYAASVVSNGVKVTLPNFGAFPTSVTPTDVVTGADGIAETASFNMGVINDVWTNSAGAEDETTFEISARVLSTVTAGQTNTLTASLSFSPTTVTTPITATVTVESLFPQMTASKSRLPAGNLDAGDVISYNVIMTCTDGANQGACYTVSMVDTLPNLFINYVPATFGYTLTPLACASGASQTLLSGSITLTFTVMTVGCQASVSYNAVILDAAVWGTTYSNSVALDFRSAPVADTDSAAATTVTTSVGVTILSPTVTMVVTSTSNADTTSAFLTGSPDLAYGETITVRLTARVPEGTPGAFKLVLTIDFSTLRKLDVVSSSRISVGGVTNVIATNGVWSDTPLTDTYNDLVTFDFGSNVSNPGSTSALDANDDIVVEAEARLMAVPASNPTGAVITITGSSITKNTASTTVTAEVVRPNLRLTKTPSISAGDAGDPVTFTVTIDWPSCVPATDSCAPAYELDLKDTLSTDFDVPASGPTISGTITSSVPVDLSSGRNIRVTVPKIMPGETVVVTYSTKISNSVGGTGSITNTATLDYTPALGVNPVSYDPVSTITNVASINISALQITSFVIDTTGNPDTTAAALTADVDLAIGEVANYKFVLRLPEGTFPVSIVFTLPDASVATIGEMEYVGSAVVATSGPLVTKLTCSPTPCDSVLGTTTHVTGSGVAEKLTIDLGTVVNTADGFADANDDITITFSARATSHGNNTPPTVASLAVLGVVNNSPTVRATATADLVVPAVTISMTNTGLAAPTNDAGDPVTMTITLSHSCVSNSCGPIYDLRLKDTLTDYKIRTTGTFTYSWIPSPAVTYISGNTAGDTSVDLTIPKLLPSSTAYTISFVVEIQNTAICGNALSNKVSFEGSTSQGNVSPSRYFGPTDSNSVSFTVRAVAAPAISFTTSLAETTAVKFTGANDFNPAEEGLVTLVWSIPECTVSLSYTFALANGSVNKFGVIAGPTGAYFAGKTTGATVTGTSTLTFTPPLAAVGTISDSNSDTYFETYSHNFGSITNTPSVTSVLTADDRLTVYVIFRLLTTPVPTPLGGGATQRYSHSQVLKGTTTTFTATNIDVVVPTMTVAKTVVPTSGVDAGDSVLYRITATCVSAASSGACYNTRIRDSMLSSPGGLALWTLQPTMVVGTQTTAGATITSGATPGDTTVDITCAPLVAGGTCFAEFTAKLTNLVLAGTDTVVNQGYIDQFGSAPTAANPLNYLTDITTTAKVSINAPTIGTVTWLTE